MNEKFSQFFKGKMSKSVYISAVSAVLCGAVAITSTVIVHEKNKKIDSILNNTVSSGSTTESVIDDTEITVSDESKSAETSSEIAPNSSFTEIQFTKSTEKGTSTEPTNDNAIQYLKEYEKLTNEYNRKRSILEEQTQTYKHLTMKPFDKTDSNYDELMSEYNDISKYNADVDEKNKKAEESIEQINDLDNQYKKDIENLKTKYGIK